MTSATTTGAAVAVEAPFPVERYPVEFGAERRPVVVTDTDLRIFDVNGAFLVEFAHTRDAVIGRALADLWVVDADAVAAELGHRQMVFHDAEPVGSTAELPAVTMQILTVRDDDGLALGRVIGFNSEQSKREKRAVSLDAVGFQMSFDQLSVGMLLTGVDGYAIRCNPAMSRILRRTAEQIAESDMLSLVHPDHHELLIEQGMGLITGELASISQETRMLAPDGTAIWVHETATCVHDEQGDPLYFVSQYIDIDDRKRAEEERNRLVDAVLERQATIEFLFEGTPIPLLELDASLTIRAANAALAELIGRDPIGVPITDLLTSEHFEQMAEQAMSVVPDTDWIVDLLVQRPDGSTRLVRSHGRIHNDPTGQLVRATAAWHDITEAQEQENRLRERASTDPLTGLPHRVTFLEQLEDAVRDASAPGTVAVLFVDLDHFKPINDRFGHEAGDHLLCQVARRLRSCVRNNDVVARLGGDEFVIMIDLSVPGIDPEIIGERVVERLAHPFATTFGTMMISASVGLARGGAGSEPRELIHRADLAAYRAKAEGRGRLVADNVGAVDDD